MTDPSPLSPVARRTLGDVLSQARDAGTLGPGPVEEQIEHALGFVEVLQGCDPAWSTTPRIDTVDGTPVDRPEPRERAATVESATGDAGGDDRPRLVDLGSGGGVPGLVLACCWPSLEVILVDASLRRCRALEAALAALPPTQAIVLHARAEELGRDPEHRGRAAAVTARSFGPPGVVAECAAPLLRTGGVLVTSEPPEERGRWSSVAALAGLGALGLEPDGVTAVGGARYHVCRSRSPVDPRYPRRPGVPARRPLF